MFPVIYLARKFRENSLLEEIPGIFFGGGVQTQRSRRPNSKPNILRP
jgi:hypothetical protein